jgi:hypothetical protein
MVRIPPFSASAHTAKRRLWAFTLALSLLGAVTNGNAQQIDNLQPGVDSATIVLMPPDVRYYVLTAGGLRKQHAEWSRIATAQISKAMGAYLSSKDVNLRHVKRSEFGDVELAYERLHRVVGMTITQERHDLGRFPRNKMRASHIWSLGPGVNEIGRQHNADYALFLHFRDYQASGGRVAFAILAAAAESYLQTGSEQGFASLVDLRTGNIVWFNAINEVAGEMRQENGAHDAIDQLFSEVSAPWGGR